MAKQKYRIIFLIFLFILCILICFFLAAVVSSNFFSKLAVTLLLFLALGVYLGIYLVRLWPQAFLNSGGREVADLVKAQELVKKSEERLRGIFEAAQNVALIITDAQDPEPLVLEFSPGAEKIFGYKREEMIGKRVSILHLREDAEKFPEVQRMMREGKQGFRGVTTLIRKSGEKFPALFTTYPLFNEKGEMYCALGVSIDITAQKKAEEALKGSRDYLDKIINSIADPIFVKDRKHHWVLLNNAHTEMFGIPKEEMLGKSDHDYFPKEEADIFWQKDEAVFETGKENINEEFWTDAKGVIHTIVTKKTLYTDNKGNKFIVGIIRDVTELKNIGERLKEALEIKSKFTSTVSHELRTPLAAIKTGVKLVLDGLAGEINTEQRDFLAIVRNNVDRLDRLINNILDLQKLESGKAELNIKESDVNEIVKEIHAAMNLVAQEKGINFILRLDSEPVRAQLDKDAVSQVLTNLINNALKFTEAGEVMVTTFQDNNFAHVTVEDTGPGIKKENLPKLFRAFEQLERKKGKKPQGTGLGLAICKEIIETHGGSIWAESEFGKGAVFHFTLPR